MFGLGSGRSAIELHSHILRFATKKRMKNPVLSDGVFGGDYRARTCDLLLVRQMLSQLS